MNLFMAQAAKKAKCCCRARQLAQVASMSMDLGQVLTAIVTSTSIRIGPVCNKVLTEETGIDGAGNFFKAVAHGVHSVTVEDLRHYFYADASPDNGIPTVNDHLSGKDDILFNAPFARTDS